MKKKVSLSTIILIIILFVGLSLLLYPSFSNWWNSIYQTRAITNYSEYVTKMDNEEYEALLQEARTYNQKLAAKKNAYALTSEEKKVYEETLKVAGGSVMGYIEIPLIDCSLPIYHTTDEAVLQVGVGHVEWTSLPVGGESTHSVLSGHRGVPSARLFTDLDKLQVGDVFVLYILDEILTYEVDQIKIVEPHETQDLLIEEGADYCTLVTCTPYGVNSHRILIRGMRTDNLKTSKNHRVTADALQIDPIIVAPIIGVPILLILLLLVMMPKKKRK